MKIYLSPQVSDQIIKYEFKGEIIKATIDGITDTFDFSNFTEGAELIIVETILPINPIISVRREEGVLWIEVINLIKNDASEQEKFPEWMEV